MGYSPGRFTRRTSARLTVGAVVAGGLLTVTAQSAQALPTTAVFSTPGTATWVVPQGVTSVVIAAYGGQGASGGTAFPGYGTGGFGAQARGAFQVTPGESFQLTVGGAGVGTGGGTGGGAAGGVGDFPGLGGGGASSVAVGGVTWVVAGGGGGAAAGGVNGGVSAAPGKSFDRSQDGRGGGGATSTSTGGAAGAGGSSAGLAGCVTNALGGPAGHAGASGSGGSGGGRDDEQATTSGGGGGGGGYTGGGGGGGGAYCLASPGDSRYGVGGGGGGGSSFVLPALAQFSAVSQGVRSGDGAIEIKYDDPSAPNDDPVLTPAPNAAGWNNSAVTVDWQWTDDGSGLNTQECLQQSGSDGQTGVLSLESTCYDAAGNAASDTVTVKVDPTAPTATPQTSGSDVGGWSRGPVTVAWSWADALSGLDINACTPTSTEGRDGVHALTATCADIAGNVGSATRTVKIDRTGPAIVVKKPAVRVVHRGQRIVLRYRCHDAGVGVATCTSKIPSRHALPTKRLGRHVVKVKAVDKLGNTRVTRVVYRVVR